MLSISHQRMCSGAGVLTGFKAAEVCSMCFEGYTSQQVLRKSEC